MKKQKLTGCPLLLNDKNLRSLLLQAHSEDDREGIARLAEEASTSGTWGDVWCSIRGDTGLHSKAGCVIFPLTSRSCALQRKRSNLSPDFVPRPLLSRVSRTSSRWLARSISLSFSDSQLSLPTLLRIFVCIGACGALQPRSSARWCFSKSASQEIPRSFKN